MEYIKDIISKLGLFNLIKKIFRKPLLKYKSARFHKNSEDVLKKIYEIMKESNFQLWFEYGTLLGAVRENDFIKHDYDLDFGMKYEANKIEKIGEKLLANGFKRVRRIALKDKVMEETYSLNGVFLDIFYFLESEENFIGYVFEAEKNMSFNETIKQKGGLITNELKLTKFSLEKIKFKGLDVLIPRNSDEHLKECYGKNYMIPNSNWQPCHNNRRKKIEILGKLK
ncbi:LicD family protein [Psychrilyobacter atlanticus]|uniref:LicD family protein n=1 Tax=Psychrilyobacter atlanticus TaxID=271091 RepID=UPI000416C8F8|nr:LicD family protein [Psychrilyobacter atlanticus]